MKNHLWVEKYRPSKLEDYIFTSEAQEISVNKIINSGNLPHLLLSGDPGTGKTTIAKIIIASLNISSHDVLTINASDENSVDVIRDKIKTFITTAAFNDYKIVHLSEADYLSIPSQAILRSLMEEEYTNVCRFILTCNYPNKIIPAIKSRCQHLEFKAHDKHKIAEFLVKILFTENIGCTLEVIDEYVNRFSPDIRKTINELQLNSTSGVLLPPSIKAAANYFSKVCDYINQRDWKACRVLLAEHINPNEWEEFYRLLYAEVERIKILQQDAYQEEAYMLIAEHLYNHSLIADPLINAVALIIKLCKIGE